LAAQPPGGVSRSRLGATLLMEPMLKTRPVPRTRTGPFLNLFNSDGLFRRQELEFNLSDPSVINITEASYIISRRRCAGDGLWRDIH
jgi:hypothetical protein